MPIRATAPSADAAAEYSLTRNWVLATDLIWSHSASTRITGSGDPGTVMR
jgi:hypothetical protein